MNQNSFCSFRWVDSLINLESCEVRSCCKTPSQKISVEELEHSGQNVFENSSYIKRRREEMLFGVKHSDCSHCWSLEAKNIFHLRNRSTSFENFIADYGMTQQQVAASELNKAVLDRLTDVHQTETLEVLLKNTCQMKCHYCNAESSSSWEIENISQGTFKKTKVDAVLREKFYQEFLKFLPTKLKSLKELKIIGGEPLLQNEFYDLLDTVEQAYIGGESPRLIINVITNLSVNDAVMDRFLTKVESLRGKFDFYLLPSIDSTGERAQYVRTGLNWDLFVRNLDKAFASRLFSTIRFIITTSVFSVSDLPQLLQFFYSKSQSFPLQSVGLVPNIVAHPAHLSPLILDGSFASYLREAIEFLSTQQITPHRDQKVFAEFLVNLERTLQSQDSQGLNSLRRQWRSWVLKYDGIRQTQFLKTHPEFVLFWNQIQTQQELSAKETTPDF